MPSCETAVRAITTFFDIRRQAQQTGKPDLALAAAKREADYRLLLTGAKEFSKQLASMADFDSELSEVLRVMKTTWIATESNKEATNGHTHSDAGAPTVTGDAAGLPRQSEGKEMQEAREIARSCLKNLKDDESVPNFHEIRGIDEVREALEEEVDSIRFPFPSRTKKPALSNVLLYGPQVTGKTQLARSFSKWSELPLFNVDFASILDAKVGMIEKLISLPNPQTAF